MVDRKQKEEKISYYFAYGSNMNHEHMKSRCPKAKYQGKFELKEHELVFRGVADVQPNKNKSVFGALFLITRDCEKALDVYEGYPNFYTKDYVNDWYEDNGSLISRKIMFYTMVDKEVIYPPFGTYLNTIIDGYKHCELSTESLKEAVNFSAQRLD